MKQRINSLLAIGVLALALTTSVVYTSNASTAKATGYTYTEEKPAQKLVISGNVEVTLVQDAESPKLYTNDGNVKANVYTDDNTIYVSAKKKGETAKITLYVDNIYRIDVSGNATVSTKNPLKVQHLQVLLKDKAKAEINSRTESIFTKLSNESSLKLDGATRLHAISTNDLANLDAKSFKAAKTEVEKRNATDYASVK